MWRNRNDRDDWDSLLSLRFVGPIVPEYAVSARGFVLGIRLEDLLSICAGKRSELVRDKARMMWVYFQVTDSLANLLEYSRSRRSIFQIRVLPSRRRGELNFSMHAYSLACLANEPR